MPLAPVMAVDFSKPETKAIFAREVQKRIDDFGMSRQQAEMLVAVLMTDPLQQERTDENPITD